MNSKKLRISHQGIHGENMNRREFIKYAGLSGIQIILGCDFFEGDAISVEEQRRRVRLANMNSKEKNSVHWNIGTLVNNLTRNMSKEEGRIKLFEFVQSFPYEIVHVDGTRTDLLNYERGDCRHKRALFYSLLENYGDEVRKAGVVFDWSDLPIPKDILSSLKNSGTLKFHSGLQIKIENEWKDVEPVWDLYLGKAGFPVVTAWDGKKSTYSVTEGKVSIIPHPFDIEKTEKEFGIKYDIGETNIFVGKLNNYLRNLRGSVREYDKPLK